MFKLTIVSVLVFAGVIYKADSCTCPPLAVVGIGAAGTNGPDGQPGCPDGCPGGIGGNGGPASAAGGNFLLIKINSNKN